MVCDYSTSTDWSQLWFPLNDRPNMVKVEREKHMKHTVTDLENPNELVMFLQASLGNYSFDTFLGNYTFEKFVVLETQIESLNFIIVPVLNSRQIS